MQWKRISGIRESSIPIHVTLAVTALLLLISATTGNCMNNSDYYLGYFQNAIGDNNVSILLITTASQSVPYYVESPGVTYYHNGTFTAKNETTINLPDSVIVSKYAIDQYFGIHLSIQTDRVNVVGQTLADYNSDTFLALPLIDAPFDTKEFVYYGMSVIRNQVAFKSTILIVGTADNTNITLRLSRALDIDATELIPGKDYSFVINKLQTFLIQSLDDLTGTKITANKQVSVFSGHEAGNVIDDSKHADHLVEQIPSTDFWGMKYYISPFATNLHTIKILAAYNSTNVTVHCRDTVKEFFTINEGQFKNLSYNQEYCSVQSNKRVLVVLFSHRTRRETIDSNNVGEPLMTLVPATIHYMNKLDFSTIRSSNNYDHYVNIIVMAEYYQPSMMYLRTGGMNTSESLGSQDWVPIVVNNITEAYAAQVAIAAGVAQIFHSNTSALMTAIVYGFGERNGYGHPAGLKLIDPCMASPCGNLGVCLPDGNSYKCKCSDGKTIRTSCTIPSSGIPVMPSTTIVSTVLSTTMITTTIQESLFHTMSPVPSPMISSTSILLPVSSNIIVTTSMQKSTLTTIPPVPSSTPTIVCSEEVDTANGVQWPSVIANTNVSINCTGGNATRFCNSSGNWEAAILKNCSSCGYKFLNFFMNQVHTYINEDNAMTILETLIFNLTNVTEGDCTDSGTSSYYYELSSANLLFEFILNITEKYPDLLSSEVIVQNIANSFSNVLDPSKAKGWEELEKVNPGQNQVLLSITERFGLLLAENFDKLPMPVVVSDNIIIKVKSVDIPMMTEDILFSNELSSIIIPIDFIRCRSEATGVNPVPIVNIHYETMQNLLSYGRNDTVQPISQVLSSQVTNASGTCDSIDNAIQLTFPYNLSQYRENSTSIPRCGYWNFLLNEGRGDWDTEGVTVVRDYRENSTIVCSSSHLTSFAVLVDVSDGHKDFSKKERTSLSILSYIGCGISIVCLLITIIILVYYRNTLSGGIHNFIHLNLAIALLLALMVFVGGIERAKEHEISCKIVAALLHYFFTAVFTWMLCEGIMLYFKLVKVFNMGLGERKLFYLAVGWGIPVPIVAISAGIAHDHYGHDEFCWIETNKGTIWGFVAPMLAIIAINVIFLFLAIRALMISQRSKTAAKENSQAKLVKSIIKATIILLPLLGITWVFGLLAVNQQSSVFAWIFTLLNSLQGMFIFIFHIIRNEKIWKKLKTCGKKEERINASMLTRQQSNTSFLKSNDFATRSSVKVASSHKLIKLRSKFDTQISITDTDFGSCSNGLETFNKKCIDHTNTPGSYDTIHMYRKAWQGKPENGTDIKLEEASSSSENTTINL